MKQAFAILLSCVFGVARAQISKQVHRRYPRKASEETEALPEQTKGTALHLRGRWLVANREALERLLSSQGKDMPSYSTLNPPVGVLTLEDVVMTHSLGEAVFRRLVDRAEFKFDRAFWRLLPVHHGSERVRAGYIGFHNQPVAVWPKDPYYHMYRKAFYRCYQDICRDEGLEACWRWRAALLTGFSQAEIRKYIRQAMEEGLNEPLGKEAVRDYPEDPDPVMIRTGIRKIPEMEDLIHKLLERGFDVWIMSSSSQWAAEAFAQLYGVHLDRVIGVKSRVAGDKVTQDIVSPVPYRVGQLEALQMFVGARPALIVGGPADDILLSRIDGLRLCIADPARRSACAGAGRLTQPRFKD